MKANDIRKFKDLFTKEQRTILGDEHTGQDPLITPAEEPWVQKSESDQVGLALSGGGIRSATFCLGVLQALQRSDLLKKVDYLSTVSGGGCIGSFWTRWRTAN